MHFCIKCDNMYYLKISENDGNSLIYYCRNCGHNNDTLSMENICVSKTQITRCEQQYNNIINEFTKLDPTLPRINTIKCPKEDCASNLDKEDKEVIYIRYDDINMKYIYLCTKCDTIWKTNKES